MNIKIGSFTKQDGVLVGHLPTLGFQNVTLISIRKPGKRPNYEVTLEGAQLGVAWDKKAASNDLPYILAQLTIPGQESFYIALFAQEEEGQYVAVYSEHRKKGSQEADNYA